MRWCSADFLVMVIEDKEMVIIVDPTNSFSSKVVSSLDGRSKSTAQQIFIKYKTLVIYYLGDSSGGCCKGRIQVSQSLFIKEKFYIWNFLMYRFWSVRLSSLVFDLSVCVLSSLICPFVFSRLWSVCMSPPRYSSPPLTAMTSFPVYNSFAVDSISAQSA